MKREKFISKIMTIKEKEYLKEIDNSNFLCHLLEERVSKKAKDLFNETFSPNKDKDTWVFSYSYYRNGNKIRCDGELLKDYKANSHRIIALLFFEEMCLEHELYKRF